jgi:hypothetical protein
MAFASIVGLQNQIRAAWNWSLSILKRDWTLSDYPISIREHAIDTAYVGTRLKQHRYTASIVNWWVVSGGGNTKGEALEELQKRFATENAIRAKEHKRLPRPGTHVPIEFASQQCVDAHPELTEDFVRRVLNLDGAWISDESSLWDFHASDDNRALIAKINEVYGVDVSDIESARLCEILERIAARQPSS